MPNPWRFLLYVQGLGEEGWIPRVVRDKQSGFRVFTAEEVEALRRVGEERRGMKGSRLRRIGE